jgi:hypothetical protein
MLTAEFLSELSAKVREFYPSDTLENAFLTVPESNGSFPPRLLMPARFKDRATLFASTVRFVKSGGSSLMSCRAKYLAGVYQGCSGAGSRESMTSQG